MGHTKSQRAFRDGVLATPVARYLKCCLVLTCPSCRDRRELRIEPLITDGRGEGTVERFISRLRCRICGNEPAIVTLQDKPGLRPEGRQIRLVGPGSY
jgi:hypothetical protein